MRKDVKILFADIYRHQQEIKDGLRLAAKLTNEMLDIEDWDTLSQRVNGSWDEADLMEKHAGAMRHLAETFIAGGDYPGQTVQMTPMESLAKE